nr:hypothetical protein [Bradyrhizobium sp.]
MASKKSSSKTGKATGFIVGSSRFRKISAVEGIHFSAKMRGNAVLSKTEDLSPEERRKLIIKAYRKT